MLVHGRAGPCQSYSSPCTNVVTLETGLAGAHQIRLHVFLLRAGSILPLLLRMYK